VTSTPPPSAGTSQPPAVTSTTDSFGVDTSTLATMTGAKAVANTALRWIPPFLPTLERAFGVSTTQLTTVIGVGEFAGLSTLAVGDHLDRGRERLVLVTSLGLVSISSVIALGGSLTTFAVAFVVLVLGVSNYTVAGHTWISHRVAYRWRARSFGIFETSWALALLLGAPIVAMLINRFGWRGPFVALAIAAAIAALVVAWKVPNDGARIIEPDPTGENSAGPGHSDGVEHPDGALSDLRQRTPLTTTAWLVVSGSALMALAGISVFVISGSWLDDAFGVSTGGIGAIAMALGAVELVASTTIVAFADRIGKLRSTVAGLATLAIGLVIMVSAGDAVIVGVAGLLVFLLGFEYGFVTSLSLTSEAMPAARGATLAIGNAVGTLARGGGTILSGVLYGAFGIGGTATLSAGAAALSLTCYLLSRRSLRLARGS
jgi:MFS transporter, DHA1 family, inner membrane transport protein